MKSLLLVMLVMGLTSSVSNAQEQFIEEEINSAGVTGGESVYSEELGENENSGIANKFSLNYFGIFYGPSVRGPAVYQPDTRGVPDKDRPLLFKNFLGLGYNVSDAVAVSGTFQWTWQPVMRHEAQVQDPFLKVSHNSIFQVDSLNLYGDLRVHLPVSHISRDNELLFGVQSVQALSYSLPEANLLLGLVGSVRANRFGSRGFGNDLELYVAPNLNFQIRDTLALTLLYEIYASHGYGARAFSFAGDGTDLEPGLAWDLTPQLTFNPYLHIPLSGSVNLNSMTFGMMMNWALI